MIKLVPQAEAMTFGHLQIFSLSLQEYVQCFQSLFKFSAPTTYSPPA